MTNLTSTNVRRSGIGPSAHRYDFQEPVSAHLTVRRDATSRSDGRVTDVLASSDRSMSKTSIFLSNPTAGVSEPAALAEFARHTVRSAAPIYDDPRDVLMRLDDLLADAYPGVFMTALFALVQQGDSAVVVSIANRGHVLPILVGARSVQAVGLHGLVLGPRSHHRPGGELTRLILSATDQLLLINDRPHGGPMPHPLRPQLVQQLPLGATDHELAEHVIDSYGCGRIDVVVVSGSSADN